MNSKNIEALIDLIATLRGENGCPWDRKQTPQTIMIYLVEEVYELFEAIESGSPEQICEELGDVFFQILFIAGLFKESGDFDIEDVARVITEKMIHRHPHVFGNDVVNDAEDVKKRWQKLKMKEKNHAGQNSVLDSVPSKLPALMRAYSIAERAAGTGFDWDDISGVMRQAEEEWSELKTELSVAEGKGNRDKVAMEFGDVLFTLVNVARFAKIHPETALADSTMKFEKRFKYMEKKASESGRVFPAVSRDEKESLWEQAKKELKTKEK